MALRIVTSVLVAISGLLAPMAGVPAWADDAPRADSPVIDLELPGQHEFVSDTAHLLTEDDKHKIQFVAERLLKDKATPLVVVTIHSMAEHCPVEMSVEAFARRLYDQWEIGSPKRQGQPWNRGILLLVSRQDHGARIELGGGLHHARDHACQRVMQEKIVPRFKQGDFSGGMVAGVLALDQLVRRSPDSRSAGAAHVATAPHGTPAIPAMPNPMRNPLPPRPTTTNFLLLVVLGFVGILFVGLLALGATAGRRRGLHNAPQSDSLGTRDAFGWPSWALLNLVQQNQQLNQQPPYQPPMGPADSGPPPGPSISDSSFGGGGGGGGSFDGGTSGGGGATGSW